MSEHDLVYNIESKLRESNSELVLTSKRIEPIIETTSIQTLLCPTKLPDDLFRGFDPDMVFNSDSKLEEECYLLNTSSVIVIVANCKLLSAKVMSFVNFVSNVVSMVDPN